MELQIISKEHVANNSWISVTSKKLHFLERFFDRINKCKIVLSKDQNENCLVEAQIDTPHAIISVKECAENFDKAIELGMIDLINEIRLIREKRITVQH